MLKIRLICYVLFEGGGYTDITSPVNGKVVLVPNFDESTVRLIVAADGGQYSLEFLILEDVDSTYFIRTSSQIEGSLDIQYNTEQGLLALIYGENSVETTSISSIERGEVSDNNDYMYYISFEFEK